VKISTTLSYAGGQFRAAAAQVVELERAGLDLVWVPEAYGFDAPSLLGYLAALTSSVEIGSSILPIYSRTPTLTAMTAAGIDALAEGRFHLGIGASGPQVVEGWHGVPYTNPVGRTIEVIDICRKVWAREKPLEHHGKDYELPLAPDHGTGLGKALKIITHPVRADIPIWIAALGQRNVSVTAQYANGWIPTIFAPDLMRSVWGDALDVGLARRDPALGPLLITAGGLLAIGDGPDVLAVAERSRPHLALYIGGMGAKGANFYNDVVRRYGFDKEAELIQDLYLSGKKDEAAAAVPTELVAITTLCGPESYIAERIAVYAAAGVTHLTVTPVPVGDQRATDLVETVRRLAG
jgi:F420-dependent oxidoreductase-like protein